MTVWYGRVAFTIGVIVLLLSTASVDAGFTFTPANHAARVTERRPLDVSVEQANDEPCRDRGWDDDSFRACEVREHTLPAGPLKVEAGRNGGIRVEAWDRNEILVLAIVRANASREEDAAQLLSSVQVEAGSGVVTSRGPSSSRRQSWSVSYRINVPRQTDLDLNASNGGITIHGVQGAIRFDTTNGGVNLRDLGGDVRGATRNGGVNVTLSGDRWEGTGLDVQTSNGGVNIAIPDGYNAELSTRTVNGRFKSDIPMTVTGELSPRRGIQTTLGSGGAPVSVRTTNGGLSVNRR